MEVHTDSHDNDSCACDSLVSDAGLSDMEQRGDRRGRSKGIYG